MTRITRKDLEPIVARINRELDSPIDAYSRRGISIGAANVGNYHLSSTYGGLSFHRVVNTSGGVRDVFGGRVYTMREMYQALAAYLAGIEDEKEDSCKVNADLLLETMA